MHVTSIRKYTVLLATSATPHNESKTLTHLCLRYWTDLKWTDHSWCAKRLKYCWSIKDKILVKVISRVSIHLLALYPINLKCRSAKVLWIMKTVYFQIVLHLIFQRFRGQRSSQNLKPNINLPRNQSEIYILFRWLISRALLTRQQLKNWIQRVSKT